MVSEEEAEKDEQEKAKSCINGSRARTIPTKSYTYDVNTHIQMAGAWGLLAMAAFGVRLRTSREDMRECPEELALDLDLTSRTDEHRRRRREAQVIARSRRTGWLRDVQFRLVLRRNAGTPPWRRLLLRQVASGFSCVSAMAMVFSYILFVLLFGFWRGSSTGGDNGFVLIFGPLLMTLIMQAVSWDQYWPNLARESLRPVGRRDFIRDLARSMAFDMAGAAAAHCALLVVLVEVPLSTGGGA